MKKRLIGAIILLLGLILVICLVFDHQIDDQKYGRDPRHFSSYLESGYYAIDPKIILTSLQEGKTNIFTPLLEDPNLVKPITDANFSWTQADFLQIASALSQFVWKEPLDLQAWSIYQITFTMNCKSNGFDYSEITYFQSNELDGKRTYITRHIEIDPYFRMVRWGGGAIYPSPILYRWNGVNLASTKITAEGALKIAEENGGEKVRLNEENECRLYVMMPISQKTKDDRWDVRYIGDHLFEILVNSYTGKYEITSKMH